MFSRSSLPGLALRGKGKISEGSTLKILAADSLSGGVWHSKRTRSVFEFDRCCFLGELIEVAVVQGQAQSSWKAEVVMNRQPTEFKVDTCADNTAVRPSLYYSLKPTHVLNKASRLLMGSCKQKLSSPGTFIVEQQVKDMLTRNECMR